MSSRSIADIPANTAPAREGDIDPVTVTTVDGGIVHAFSRGTSSNPPIVLVNALGMPARFWEPLGRALEHRFFLITWEPRGGPAADAPFDPQRCGPREHASDMQAVMKAYGIVEAFAIGWCSGCQVTLRYATQPGNGLIGAALLNGSYCLPGQGLVSEYAKTMRTVVSFCSRGRSQAQSYSDALMRSFTTAAAAPSSSATERGIASGIPDAVADMTMEPFRSGEALFRYASTQRRFMDEPTGEGTGAVRVPVLLVGGDKDQIVHPDGSREMARRLADVELVMYPDGDHYLHFLDSSIPLLIEDFYSRRIGGPGRQSPPSPGV